MIRIIAAILAMTVMAADAQILTALVTAYRLITNQSAPPVHYIQVESTAPDLETAKQQAFRQAIELVVGTVVVNETESKRQQLIRNDVINHSSGFVDRYKILNQTEVNGSVKITVDIWVAHSAIANRILNNSTTAGELDGDRIHAQASTALNQLATGERLLNTVLADFPQRAFDVKIGVAEVMIDSRRQIQISVPITVTWNQTYIKSLEDALSRINQYRRCGEWLADCSRLPSIVIKKSGLLAQDTGAWFNDDRAVALMFNQLMLSQPTYRVTLHGEQDLVYCAPAYNITGQDQSQQYLFYAGKTSTVIYSNKQATTNGKLDYPWQDARETNKITVEILRSSQCR